jgi:hypothetical protein
VYVTASCAEMRNDIDAGPKPKPVIASVAVISQRGAPKIAHSSSR